MTVKTDRKDACGRAQLLRMGWFQQVHATSIGSQEIRALLVARKQLLGRLLDVELSIRGILRGFGLKVAQVTRKTFEARIRELVTGHTTLERIAEAMLLARSILSRARRAAITSARNIQTAIGTERGRAMFISEPHPLPAPQAPLAPFLVPIKRTVWTS